MMMEDKVAGHNTKEGRFRRSFGGVALGGALAAYLVSPLLKFANPWVLALAGVIAGIGLLGLYNARVVPNVKPFAEKVAWLCIVVGGSVAILDLVFAGMASQSLDNYCAGVQARLIDADRRGAPIGEGKDVLQALQCRPQEVLLALPPIIPPAGRSAHSRVQYAPH